MVRTRSTKSPNCKRDSSRADPSSAHGSSATTAAAAAAAAGGGGASAATCSDGSDTDTELVTPPVRRCRTPSTPARRPSRAACAMSELALVADRRRHSSVVTTPLKTPAVPARRFRSHSMTGGGDGGGTVGSSSVSGADRCRSLSMDQTIGGDDDEDGVGATAALSLQSHQSHHSNTPTLSTAATAANTAGSGTHLRRRRTRSTSLTLDSTTTTAAAAAAAVTTATKKAAAAAAGDNSVGRRRSGRVAIGRAGDISGSEDFSDSSATTITSGTSATTAASAQSSSASAAGRRPRRRTRSLTLLEQQELEQLVSNKELLSDSDSDVLPVAPPGGVASSPSGATRGTARKSRRLTILQKIDEEADLQQSARNVDSDSSGSVDGGAASSGSVTGGADDKAMSSDDCVVITSATIDTAISSASTTKDVAMRTDADDTQQSAPAPSSCSANEEEEEGCAAAAPDCRLVEPSDCVVAAGGAGNDSIDQLITRDTAPDTHCSDSLTHVSTEHATDVERVAEDNADAATTNTSAPAAAAADAATTPFATDVTTAAAAEISVDMTDVSQCVDAVATDDSALGHDISASPQQLQQPQCQASVPPGVLRALDIINSCSSSSGTPAPPTASQSIAAPVLAADADQSPTHTAPSSGDSDTSDDDSLNDSGVSPDNSHAAWRRKAALTAAGGASVVRGRCKSWRPWKCPRTPCRSVRDVDTSTVLASSSSSSTAKAAAKAAGKAATAASYCRRMQQQKERRHVQQLQQRLAEERREQRRVLRLRQEANRKRAAEGERRAETYQVIKNPAKLKRIKRKELRKLQKRDTTVVEKP